MRSSIDTRGPAKNRRLLCTLSTVGGERSVGLLRYVWCRTHVFSADHVHRADAGTLPRDHKIVGYRSSLHQGLEVVPLACHKALWLRLSLACRAGDRDSVRRVLIGAEAYFTRVVCFDQEGVVTRFRREQPAAKPASKLLGPVLRCSSELHELPSARIVGIARVAGQVRHTCTANVEPPLADDLARSGSDSLEAPDLALSFCSEDILLIDPEVVSRIAQKYSWIVGGFLDYTFVRIARTGGHLSLVGAKEHMVLYRIGGIALLPA